MHSEQYYNRKEGFGDKLTSGTPFICLKAMQMSLDSASLNPWLGLVALVGEEALVPAAMMLAVLCGKLKCLQKVSKQVNSEVYDGRVSHD